LVLQNPKQKKSRSAILLIATGPRNPVDVVSNSKSYPPPPQVPRSQVAIQQQQQGKRVKTKTISALI